MILLKIATNGLAMIRWLFRQWIIGGVNYWHGIVVLNLIINGMEKREYTGVKTRDNKKIYVGDKVDTVQGSVFTVIKLEHISGIKYALHDGERPYDLEPFMSPNLWLVEESSACS